MSIAKYGHIQFRVPDDIFVEFAEILSKAEFVIDISRAYICTTINPTKYTSDIKRHDTAHLLIFDISLTTENYVLQAMNLVFDELECEHSITLNSDNIVSDLLESIEL